MGSNNCESEYMVTGSERDGYTIRKTGGPTLEFDGSASTILVLIEENVVIDEASLPYGWSVLLDANKLWERHRLEAGTAVLLKVRAGSAPTWWPLGGLTIVAIPAAGRNPGDTGPYGVFINQRQP